MSIVDKPLLVAAELEAQFSENALTVLSRRYLRKDENGELAESLGEMFQRVAHHVAQAELANGDPQAAEDLFYRLLTRLRFIPNSPTFTGAGTPLGQLAACFVLPIADDMGKKPGGIFQSLRDAALIQQTGGGNGFSFSRLRPKESLVLSSMGQATGPVGFLRVYDRAFGEIAQGGSRRGANMAVLRVDHPDIAEFVTCKTSEDAITNFNISVGMLDDFMAAVEADEEWTPKFPDVADPAYRDFHSTLEDAAAAGIPLKSYQPVRARDLFDKIARQAWRNGEPGMLFLDTAQQDNPVPNLGNYECTNPCGEQFLLPYENCCLGSVNLARHLTTTADGDPGVDWDKLAETVHLATRFLDDVISANAYVPAVPQLREAAQRTRRIGLGIMGLADLLYHLRLRYGSQDAQEVAAQVMEFIRYHTLQASVALAEQRGPFPAIKGSRYDPQDLTWQPPQWPQWLGTEPRPLWERPALDWDTLRESIREHGIRNAAQLTIAPTGTIATVAGAEGYGCEPAFALAYTRYVHEAGEKIALRYLSPAFAKALEKEELDADTQDAIFQQVLLTGSCQTVT
ncbi:MAG: adenosylcobalamin-dependent ribonucleoside-diphosphate reductase, partial [Chloroflexota bacterium]|nr:adenosylcobalamin-dependent ribonucleoside-diphosphate reductase [Chloroflexota bacterium]